MISTKHCCWGQCKSDSRYPEKLPKSLKEMKESGQKIFFPFPKPKCQRWVTACSRENFDVSKISRNTYICALHWPGEKGPTADHPDPLKVNFTPKEIKKASAAKRKAPKARSMPTAASKKLRLNAECDVEGKDGDAVFCMDMEEADQVDGIGAEGKYLSPSTGNVVLDRGTQTEYSKYVLSSKVETMVLRNKVATRKDDSIEKVVASLCHENVKNDPTSMKHFVGLTTEQFEALYCFLDSVCPMNDIVYWKAKESTGLNKGNTGPDSKLANREKLFICLLRLRREFTIKTLTLLLSSPERKIEETMVRQIFTTLIQLMYKIFRDMDTVMFPTRYALRRSLPKVFKMMRNVRCIVDCTEFSVQRSRNFARQENTYPHTNIPTHLSVSSQLPQMVVLALSQGGLKETLGMSRFSKRVAFWSTSIQVILY